MSDLHDARMRKVRRLAEKIAEKHDVTVDAILGDGRERDVAKARKDLMTQLWREGYSHPVIGQLLQRDHTTVMAGIRSFLGDATYYAESHARKFMPHAAKVRVA